MASNVIQSTLQLLGDASDINEDTVNKIMNKYGGELVQVKQVRMLSDVVGSTLVTITATEKGEFYSGDTNKPLRIGFFSEFYSSYFNLCNTTMGVGIAWGVFACTDTI